MEERRSVERASQENGTCRCHEIDPVEPFPGEGESIRRLIKAIEAELEEYEPTEATKKLSDELKDADKEYRGITDIATKYEEFYDKLDGMLAAARSWRKDLREWCESSVNEATREAIKALRENSYDAKEKEYCCKAIDFGDRLTRYTDCRGQRQRKEEEAQSDYKEYKEFEKNMTDRFGVLKSLFDQGKALREKEQHKAVCAVSLEFAEVYHDLGVVHTWEYWRGRCRERDGSRSYYGGEAGPGEFEAQEQDESQSSGRGQFRGPVGRPGDHAAAKHDLKRQWPPERFKKELAGALRRLILAKYQRFRYQQQWLEVEDESKRFRDACDKFRATRREEFIQEAEDVETVQTSES